jgi:hypothetical protein
MRFNPARSQPASARQRTFGMAVLAASIRNAAPALQSAGLSVDHAAPPGAAKV